MINIIIPTLTNEEDGRLLKEYAAYVVLTVFVYTLNKLYYSKETTSEERKGLKIARALMKDVADSTFSSYQNTAEAVDIVKLIEKVLHLTETSDNKKS